MIDAKQLLSFFEAEYAQDVEADEIKKGISDELKAYAENIEVSPKSIKTAHGDAINGRNFHEMCRYGIQCGCNSEDDVSRFVEELEKIANWLEEGM